MKCPTCGSPDKTMTRDPFVHDIETFVPMGTYVTCSNPWHSSVQAGPPSPIAFVSDKPEAGPSCKYCGAVMAYQCWSCREEAPIRDLLNKSRFVMGHLSVIYPGLKSTTGWIEFEQAIEAVSHCSSGGLVATDHPAIQCLEEIAVIVGERLLFSSHFYSKLIEKVRELKAASHSLSAAPIEEAPTLQYVIVADGEGAQACVIVDTDLHQAVHDFMCCCGKNWRECDSNCTWACEQLDKTNDWTKDEAGNLFSMTWPHETGSITIYRLSRAASHSSSPTPPPFQAVDGTCSHALHARPHQLRVDCIDWKQGSPAPAPVEKAQIPKCLTCGSNNPAIRKHYEPYKNSPGYMVQCSDSGFHGPSAPAPIRQRGDYHAHNCKLDRDHDGACVPAPEPAKD